MKRIDIILCVETSVNTIQFESLAQAKKEWVTCAKLAKALGTRLRNVAYFRGKLEG